MSVLPATGSAISMGRTQQAYNNVAAGTGAAAPTGSTSVRLSASLGANYAGNPVPISFSSTFGGRTTPYTY
jgi:hypothetical protein